MKKFTKLLVLVLSLVMVVSCFAACSGDKKEDTTATDVKTSKTNTEELVKEEVVGKSDEEEVKAFVEDFFKTFQKGDLESLAGCFKESSSAYDEIMANFNMDDITEMTSGMEDLGLSESEVADMLTNMFESLFGEIEYKIGDIEVDGDKATVEYEMSYPDYNSVDQSSLDTDSIMMKALEDDGYSMDKLATMTEDDITKIMPKIINSALDAMIDAMIDAAKDAGTVDENGKFELEKIDGKWFIVADI